MMLRSGVSAACDTLSHVETMSLVKGARPAGVPSLFLPANENESGMPHSVSSPPLFNKNLPCSPTIHTTLEKVHS